MSNAEIGPESRAAPRSAAAGREGGPSATPLSEQTFLAFATAGLEALGAATGGFDAAQARAVGHLGQVLGRWGTRAIGHRAAAPSDIGDDQFPIEFSVAFLGEDAEVRVLFECDSHERSMADRWAAGQRSNQRLEQHFGVSLARFDAIRDLFAPTDSTARYVLWHSMCLRRDRPPKFKVYVNPQAQGPDRAPAVVHEALRRLGFVGAAERVSASLRPGEEFKFFSLDLDPSPDARVKVYKVHRGAHRRDIERELAAACGDSAAPLTAFFERIVGSDGPFCALPISTYVSLTSREERAGATIHFPIRAYANDDQVVYERVRRFLSGSDRTHYERALAAFASRPLRDGAGMHSYVSLGFDDRLPRLTVYLSPQVYDRGEER